MHLAPLKAFYFKELKYVSETYILWHFAFQAVLAYEIFASQIGFLLPLMRVNSSSVSNKKQLFLTRICRILIFCEQIPDGS